MASNGPLKGKVAIITGSSKSTGIGAAIATVLAKQGANILIHYNSNASRAEEMVQKLQSLGVKAAAAHASARSLDFGTTLVTAAQRAFDTSAIDIVVNNAGTVVYSLSLADLDIASFDEAYHINVRAALLLIQAAVPHMPSGGRIVNIGSIIAKMGHAMLPVLAGSKAALTTMSVCLAEELGPKGITVNVVAPGPIETEHGVDPEAFQPVFAKLLNNAHMKRVGTSEEVASAVGWLASPLAGYVTGQLIPVDGGSGWP